MEGKTVICISKPDDDHHDILKVGEEYIIDYVVKDRYVLTITNHWFIPFDKKHFKSLSDMRNEKIEKLYQKNLPWYKRLLNL